MDRKSRTSRSATLDSTNEEVSLWKQICIAFAKLENIQKDTANVVTNINHIHTAVNFDQGIWYLCIYHLCPITEHVQACLLQ
jgi:SAGA-associated factor 29